MTAINLEHALDDRVPSLPDLCEEAEGLLLIGLPAACRTPQPRFHAIERQRYARRYTDLALGFEAYFGRFSAKRRSTLRRKERRLAERCGGALDIRSYRTPAEVEAFFSLARPLSGRTYQEQRLGAGLPDSAAFRSQAAKLAAADRLRAWLLFVDGAPAAYLYAPADGATVIYDYLGYDPDLADFSPGTVLQLHAMRELMEERRFRWFDFGGGDGDHKRQFATGAVECVDMLLLRRQSLPNAAAAVLLPTFDRMVAVAKRVLNAAGGGGLVRFVRR